MSKKITKVSPRSHGHLHLEFEDSSQQMLMRGEHEKHALKVGDYWPPAQGSVGSTTLPGAPKEKADAVDEKTSEKATVKRKSTKQKSAR